MGCSFATPRMPSVPKSFLSFSAMGFALPRLGWPEGFNLTCKSFSKIGPFITWKT